MKKRLICLAIWSLSAAPRAFAVGGQNSQGTLFAGTGLDWQHMETHNQEVPSFESGHFPPPESTTPLTKSFMGVEIKLGKCENPGDKLYATCGAEVRLKEKVPESHFCGVQLTHARSADGSLRWLPVKLYALDATHDLTGGLRFNQPNGPHPFTLACRAEDPKNEAQWRELGAIGKCLRWQARREATPQVEGFLPDKKSTKEFLTCIRAVRADYCGDGVSYTKDGTIIDLYEKGLATIHQPQPAFVLEANWQPDGAICIIHTRYMTLSPECQDRYQNFIGLVPKPDKGTSRGLLGNEYWCRGKKYDMPWGCETIEGRETCKFITRANEFLRQGILMDDSVIQP